MRKAGLRLTMLVALIALVFQSTPTHAANDSYADRLYSPMFITKIAGLYFIADSWNHRLLYSKDVRQPIKDWKVLDNDIAAPHSIAGNGTIFVSEDTGRDRLIVYTLTTKGFVRTQTIAGIKGRPHRTIYDSATQKFYVLTSDTQNIYTLSIKDGKVLVDSKKESHLLRSRVCPVLLDHRRQNVLRERTESDSRRQLPRRHLLPSREVRRPPWLPLHERY
ncbi:NHL repeat-containing protein [Cohnella rhizosphaerae]|uniref:Uncharacterized protein n=1 Tax=Cohnella rhizosphaerae TaxID=1457232 RepID=A0A9X4KUM0_9BACL|nr:hypothetical protein [Cohnella rhizosphaerae]MDG0810571.1 hypothetical protein [Cohnella rhizosphaerae]